MLKIIIFDEMLGRNIVSSLRKGIIVFDDGL